MNPYSIRQINGVPALFKDGVRINPILFWSSDVDRTDFPAFRKIGITLFTCFRSSSYYDHPYWVGENEYDFSYYDEQLTRFMDLVPDGYIIPRIFVAAPYWWLEKHPEELVGYADGVKLERGISATFHESFASERWKREQGEAFRQLMRHFRSAPYGSRIAGIQVAGGPCGEWHYWGGDHDPDCGPAMAKRLGRPVPPPELRDPEYRQCFYSSTIEAIDRFCRIVREESDWLTVVFYGYLIENSGQMNSAHVPAEEFMRLKSVDIAVAPHTYLRREGGRDAYFRAYPASLALHGKLFLDESDDRTTLGKRKYVGYGGGCRIMAETREEAVGMLCREFGNAGTHGVGQWFMDIDGGMFRDPLYMETISKLVRAGEQLIELPNRRVSEIAVIADPGGNCWYTRRQNPAPVWSFRNTIASLMKCGAPFDLFCADDLDAERMKRYKLIIAADCAALSGAARETLRKLRCDGRTFLWHYGAGSVSRSGKNDPAGGMSDLTGIRFTLTPSQRLPRVTEGCWDMDAVQSPGFLPESADIDFGSWRSVYRPLPDFTPAEFRKLCRENRIHVYSETDDVLSVSENLLMLHASSDGMKKITLPKNARVEDLLTGRILGESISECSFPLRKGDTALLKLTSRYEV